MKTTLGSGKVIDMKEPHFFDRVELGSFAKYMELVPPRYLLPEAPTRLHLVQNPHRQASPLCPQS